jgi:hypothetical protein
MAVKFHPLPVEDFPEALQPWIARHNRELRDLFGLEGAIAAPVNPRRSDLTVARNATQHVHSSQVTEETLLEIIGIDREASLGAAPAKVIIKVLAGPPDKAYISLQHTGGIWKWTPLVNAV